MSVLQTNIGNIRTRKKAFLTQKRYLINEIVEIQIKFDGFRTNSDRNQGSV